MCCIGTTLQTQTERVVALHARELMTLCDSNVFDFMEHDHGKTHRQHLLRIFRQQRVYIILIDE